VGAYLLLAGFTATSESAVYGYGLAAFAILVVAALTDALDGLLARLLNAESALGALLDPIADKLLVGSYLVAFVVVFRFDILLMIPVAIILLRDLTVTGLRLTAQKPSTMAATSTAKLKTFFQMLLVMMPFGWAMLRIDSTQANADFVLFWTVAVWFLAAVTVWSALPYWRARKAG
jgi:CDP-diacylglycerol--glycerol-3-phosphate 3-phosphatidyltransferase